MDQKVFYPSKKKHFFQIVLLFGISGACRCDELVKMKVQDIEDHGSIIYVKIPDSKTSAKRSFTIVNDNWLQLYRKYIGLRPDNMSENRFSYTSNRKMHPECDGHL